MNNPKIALYCRVSKSDGSQDTQRQIDNLTAFCTAQGWQIIDTITENVSRRRKQRKGTQRLINLARSNQITKVLVHAVNRLGRNLADTFNTIEELTQEKVSVYVFTQRQETLDEFGNKTPFATLVMPVLAGVAEDWTRQHAESIKSGQRRSKKKPGRPKGQPIKKEKNLFSKSSLKVQTKCGSLNIEEKEGMIFLSQKAPDFYFMDPKIYKEILSVFSLKEMDLLDFPIAGVHTGLGHLIFGVKSRDVLFEMKANKEMLKKICNHKNVREAQIFTFDTKKSDHDIHTRNFCPRDGAEMWQWECCIRGIFYEICPSISKNNFSTC